MLHEPNSRALKRGHDGAMKIFAVARGRTGTLIANVVTNPFNSTFALEGICREIKDENVTKLSLVRKQ